MDVATHSAGEQYKMKVRIQSAGNKLNVKVNLNCNFQTMGSLKCFGMQTDTLQKETKDLISDHFMITNLLNDTQGDVYS